MSHERYLIKYNHELSDIIGEVSDYSQLIFSDYETTDTNISSYSQGASSASDHSDSTPISKTSSTMRQAAKDARHLIKYFSNN